MYAKQTSPKAKHSYHFKRQLNYTQKTCEGELWGSSCEYSKENDLEIRTPPPLLFVQYTWPSMEDITRDSRNSPERYQSVYVTCYLTHCGLLMLYGNIEKVNISLGNGLVPWWHQAITWINVDVSSVRVSNTDHKRYPTCSSLKLKLAQKLLI